MDRREKARAGGGKSAADVAAAAAAAALKKLDETKRRSKWDQVRAESCSVANFFFYSTEQSLRLQLFYLLGFYRFGLKPDFFIY
jgi:hypothetical protein